MQIKLSSIKELNGLRGCILTYGHFSTIHPGHIRYLHHAKSLGNQLVIALIGDKSSIDYPYSQKDRADALDLLGIADAVLMLESDELDKAINILEPTVLVLGSEYKNKSNMLMTLDKQRNAGRSIQFHAGEIHYATAELLSGSESYLRQQRRAQFLSACKRQDINRRALIDNIKKWEQTKLLVIGDTIVDQYAACEAIGMSAEAPVVVVKELEHRNFLGGAAVVAAHINALGAKCDLISIVGEDENAKLVVEQLSKEGIGNQLTVDASRPTTFKKRYVVENQKLFRVSRLEEHNLDSDVENSVIASLERLAPQTDGIVVSDFVYGVITPRILDKIDQLSKKYNLLLFGDLQCSSQVGTITKFKNFSLLCPNEREARLALQDRDAGLEQLSMDLLDSSGAKRLVMKLGSGGFIAYDRTSDNQLMNQAFPALSVNPVDVAGAGDSLLAVFATGIATKQRMMPTAALACCMAELAVETMGNTPISANTLMENVEKVFQDS